jgi:hypothetical protein
MALGRTLKGLLPLIFWREISPTRKVSFTVSLNDLPDFRISDSSFARTSSSKVMVVLMGTP